LNGRRPSVAFRVDAGVEIGLGHLTRCATLADALSRRGAAITFVCRQIPPHMLELLAERGHLCEVLASGSDQDAPEELAHSNWLGTSQATDASDTAAALGQPADWLVVDHYGLDARWEVIARSAARRVLVIDDLADRSHDADALLDQNLYPDFPTRYDTLVREECALFLGPRYALLRPEFASLRESTPCRNGVVRRLLVLLGGVDSANFTETAVRAIYELRRGSLRVDVVVGATHPALDTIRALCAEFGYECHIQSRDVARLMAAADLTVGAAGATSWERCCLGLPAVGVTLAANQVPIAEALAAAGAIVNLGDARRLTVGTVAQALGQLILEPGRIMAMSVAARAVTDGHGTDRVCDYMLPA
jgi:UDP-2,4-diacetamido-2,4,6-trideoxy-beta-L-altropyranose hydrolase